MLRGFHLILTFALLAVLPIGAYVQSRNGAGSPLRRDAAVAADVQFFMNDQVMAGMTNESGRTILAAGSDPLGGLRQAAAHWDSPPDSILRTKVAGTTDAGYVFNDGVNVILVANSPESRSVVGEALAVAVPWSFDNGLIFDSDIIFSDAGLFLGRPLEFTTDIVEGAIHLPSVASHEIGHSHGLNHSGVAGATMFARTSTSTNVQETPKQDDLTFVRDVYRMPDVGARFGSIQGMVSRSGGGTANGVFVAAVDPSSGVVVSTLTNFTNGTFDTGPIPPGNYFISAEPVDGPAITSDFPGVSGFDLDVRDGFFGGNGNPQMVSVAAGKGIAAANFAIETGAKSLEIRRLGIGPANGNSIDTHGPSPRELKPGEAYDLFLWGPGIDGTLTNANVRIFGNAVTIRPGSVAFAPGFGTFGDGVYTGSFVRMTVDVAASVQGIHLATVAVFKGAEAAVFTGGLVIKRPDPEFTSAGLAHSARLEAGNVAEEEIVALFGLALADFDQFAVLPLGTQLGGASVDVTDSQGVTRPCLMFAAVSDIGRAFAQLNFMIPDGTATGAGSLRVRRASGGSHTIAINVVPVNPGIFTANSQGTGFPAANTLRFVDGALTQTSLVTAAPIDLGAANHQVFLSLFLTGVRNGNPAAVQVSIGGMPMTTIFGPAESPEFAGLDQLNVLLERVLIGRSLVQVVITVDGIVANVVQINIL